MRTMHAQMAARSSVLTRGVFVALTGAFGLALLLAIGPPTVAPLALALAAATLLLELLLIDFPDRRRVSLVALPMTLAAAEGGLALAVWAAAVGTGAAALIRTRAPAPALFGLGRAAIATAAAVSIVQALLPERLGSATPLDAAPAAIVVALVFSLLSELLSAVARWIDPSALATHADPVASVAVAPLAIAAWAVGDRIGANGALLASGGLLALLVVVRSTVNTGTRNADLEGLSQLARSVAASATPADSLAALARELPRWVPFDQLWLGLAREGAETDVHVAGLGQVVRPDFDLSPRLLELTAEAPRVVPADLLPAGSHAVAAAYGRRGVLLVGRRSREFSAEEMALLELLLGQLSAIFEQIRLVDELGRTMAELRATQQERDDFVNVMTHDLRQPLAGMLGYAQLLERALREQEAEARLQKYAGGIASGGQRMMRMIDNLLELARVESDRIELEHSVVKVDQMADEIVETFQASIEQKRQTVRVDVEPSLPALVTSEPLLRESLSNLFGNAVKYTPDEGRLEIRARREGEGVTIDIADTGIGIPPEAIENVFKRFFRTGQSEVRELRGSGLGLALTKMMIEKIGGDVRVASELGRGSTFTVTLPLRMPK